jgi:hypothetical protein
MPKFGTEIRDREVDAAEVFYKLDANLQSTQAPLFLAYEET